MYPIKDKCQLTPTVSKISVLAPDITRHAKAGQFVMLRVEPDGERIPMTIADIDKQAGTVSIIFQVVGATTHQLNQLDTGDQILDFVGPLGKPTAIEGLAKVAVVGGG
ncbi:MAG: sulfide/dihydroorotate dehydrogenase-like FAD/NAD-binding protein, partial [Acholeplasmataceae bacterium]